MDNASSEPTVMPLDLLREITNDFSEERKLGSGSFGKVYLGVNRDGEKIAVKKLYDMPGLDEEHFQNEFKNLTRLRHKNIVRLVGYFHDVQEVQVEYKGKLVIAEKTNRALCLEYMPNGSLDKYLSDECDKYDWRTGYGIIKGICEGLKYLHKELKPPIYHLDLKPGNVLLDKNMGPRIADFGMSRLFGDEQTRATKSSLGTLGYLPPEYIRRHLVSNKFDIFSLGVVIIKIMAGHTGYFNSAELSSQKFINLVHQNWTNRLHETLSVMDAYSEQIKICIKIGLSCVQEDQHKRPTIQHIVDILNKTETNCTFASRNGPSLMYQDTFGDLTQPGNIYNPNHRQANPSRNDPSSSYNTEASRNAFRQYAQHPNDRHAERIYDGPTFNQYAQDLVGTIHSNCFEANAGRRVTRLEDGWQKDNQEYSGDPLPGIEGFQIVSDPRLGSTLKACGFLTNATATTPCTFQVANRNSSLQYAQDLNNRHTEQINHAAFHRPREARLNDDLQFYRNDSQDYLADGNPLPGTEGYYMVGGSRIGVTSRARGFPTKRTTPGNFQWFCYPEYGNTQPIKGATCQVSHPSQDNQNSKLMERANLTYESTGLYVDTKGYLVREFAHSENETTCRQEGPGVRSTAATGKIQHSIRLLGIEQNRT